MFQAFQQAFASRPLPHLTIGCSVGWEGVRPAFAVHRRYRTPFVVEFQDPWKSYIPSTWRFSEKFVHGTVRHAAATINVTPKWCDDDALDFGKQVLCVLNGFPPEVLGRDPAPGQPGQGQPVRIGYFGTMLCPGFDYEGWLRGLASVAPEQAHFCYAGRNHQDIDRLSQALGTSDRVLAEPPISIWDVFERQRTMDALLLFSFSARNGHFGFKMAETLASGRPVLVVGPDDPWLGDALACGTRVLWARDEREVHQVLRALAAEKARTGIVAGEWKVEAVRPYGWDRIAARLIADIASLLEQPGGTRPPTGPAAPHV
jgi:hypothetical protein